MLGIVSTSGSQTGATWLTKGRNLLQGWIGEEKQWEKNKCFISISLFNTKKLHSEFVFIRECLQYISATCFIIILRVSSFSPLLGHTRYQGSQSVVSSSRTTRPSNTWGGWWIGHWKTTWSTVRSSAPHPQAAETAIPHCANRCRNVWHPCGGYWVEPTLSVAHIGILFWGVNYLRFFQLVLPFISEQLKVCHGLRPHSGYDTARYSWQCHSRRVFRGWKYGVSCTPTFSAFHRTSVFVVI